MTPKKRSEAKTPAPASSKPAPGSLVVQPHGGALKTGGNPGNRGGSGPPPSALRDRLRGAMADRIPVIEQIADGEAMVRKEFRVIDVLRHVHCPKCGGGLAMNVTDAIEAMSITVLGKTSPSSRDRISAIDLAAKYGLGTKDEISVVSADVQSRLEAQAARFVAELGPDALAIVKRITDEVWQ